MPIRMQKDRPEKGEKKGNRRSPGGILKWLPIILLFVFRKPKIGVPLLIVGGLVYFFFLRPSSSSSYEYSVSNSEFSFGAALSQEEYDKAKVYEPVSTFSSQSQRSHSLLPYAPPRLHQGRQGSCSGWAAAYAGRTIAYAKANNANPNRNSFSPSFLYNQIALPNCEGAYLREAMESMRVIGALPFKQFGYTDQSCELYPKDADKRNASQYRIKGYNRLSVGANRYGTDLNSIKQHIDRGAPVVVGMMVGESFMSPMRGRDLWQPNRSDYAGNNLGGHAMCVIGYDDKKYGGAFQLMNSWGNQWGNDGNTWVRYDDFARFTKEAYGIFPEGKSKDFDPDRLNIEYGLVDNRSQNLIRLKAVEDLVVRTENPLSVGQAFKVAITNNVECYTYIFGQETDQSVYTLFPYTEKHSPYCGITGTRLFPKDYSLVPDNIGSMDFIAVVVSKQPLDYKTLETQMNKTSGDILNKVSRVFGNRLLRNCETSVGGSIRSSCSVQNSNQVLAKIIAIDKRQ